MRSTSSVVRKPNWTTYQQLLKLCDIVFQELRDLEPNDYIDLQSFIWSIGDDNYKTKPTGVSPTLVLEK